MHVVPVIKQPHSRAIALTIAGSDSSGGAGVQADLKAFSTFGVYGASVITALTAQNTKGVQGVHVVPASFVAEQLHSLQSDLDIKAVKTGMLANAAIVSCVAEILAKAPHVPLVVDPVMIATSGERLLADEAEAALKDKLLPVAALMTPNLDEAATLLGISRAQSRQDMIEQGHALQGLGAAAVLLKGGHLSNQKDERTADDLLVKDGQTQWFSAPWVETANTHGTGCSLAAAITAGLAMGHAMSEAIADAKAYITAALSAGLTLGVGHGNGPVDHLAKISDH